MSALLTWDGTGEKVFETGTDRGVYYPLSETGEYTGGVAWNGLTAVSEAPSGAESNKHYADNVVYANILSAEEFAATIEAFTWPDEFDQSDGLAAPAVGLTLGQQGRRPFGFAYRTILGNDVAGQDFGYKLHLVYGLTAAPSTKDYSTVSDSTEPVAFSWECTSTPVGVGEIAGIEYKPTSLIVIDSTKVDEADLTALEAILYGTAAIEDPVTAAVPGRLPLPSEVVSLFS